METYLGITLLNNFKIQIFKKLLKDFSLCRRLHSNKVFESTVSISRDCLTFHNTSYYNTIQTQSSLNLFKFDHSAF